MIIGAAFGGIITSLVKDIIMPPIGLLTGGLDFSNKFVVLKAGADGVAFRHPGRRGQSQGGYLELREFHHAGDQFHHRGVLYFPGRQGDEQDETPSAPVPSRSRKIVRPAR